MKFLLMILFTVFVGELPAQTNDACQKCKKCLPLAEDVRKNTAEYEEIKAKTKTTYDQEAKARLNIRLNNNRSQARQLQEKLTQTGCWGYIKYKNCDNLCRGDQSNNSGRKKDSQGREIWNAGDGFGIANTGRISIKRGKAFYDFHAKRIEIPIGAQAEMRYTDGTFLNLKATAWQIVESELDHQDVANDIQPYLDQRYIPLAISTLADQWFYTLLVHFGSFPATNWSLKGYSNTKSLDGVDGEINRGYVPAGYLSANTIINVLYLKMF